MAAVIESFLVPRFSGVPRIVPVSGRASLSGSLSSRRKFAWSECRGLRIETRSQGFSLPVITGKDRRKSCSAIVCEAQETATVVPAVTEATWQSLVIEGDLPVLVEFWAPWCGPCRVIDPVIGELSVQYAGKLKCFKLNTDESPKIATQYGIRSIPTVIIFKNGEKKDAVIGAVPKSTLIANIEKFLER